MATLRLSLPDVAMHLRETGRSLADLQRRLPMRQAAILVRTGIQMAFQNGTSPEGVPWTPIKFRVRGGSKPLLDTGVLRNSIQNRVEDDNRAIVSWTNKIQAPLMHFGGVVRPRRGKFLAIPLTKEAQRAGSPRNFGSPLVPRIGDRGGVLLGITKGTKKTPPREVAHYALVKESVIPARPFMGYSRDTLSKIATLMQEAVAAFFQGG